MKNVDNPMKRAGPLVWMALGGVVLFLAGVVVASRHGAQMDHQAVIDTRSAEVMPFDLNKTTHVFQKTDGGGDESVVAIDAQDRQQVELIRTHLQDEANKFKHGDYEDPARIHGMDMPGLRDLETGYSRVQVAYAELPAGGHITFVSTDPILVGAIHAWFDRQLRDHGAHATSG